MPHRPTCCSSRSGPHEYRDPNCLLKPASLLLTSHALAQATQLLAGLYIVRELPIYEYAVYTLFSTALSTWSAFGDLGLSQVLVSVGAKAADSPWRVRRLVAYAIKWSGGLTIIAGAFVTYYFASALPEGLGREAQWVFFTILCAQAAAALFERISIAARNLYLDAAGYSRAIVLGSATRLGFVLVVVSFVPSWEIAATSIIVGSLVTIAAAGCRSTMPSVGGSTTELQRAGDDVVALALSWRRIVPVALYGMIQGQLPVLLAATTANPAEIGAFGALTRVGQIVSILGILNSVLLNSYLSRLATDRQAFVRALLAVIACFLGYVTLLVVITLAWPSGWLMIIGDQYAPYVSLLLPVIFTYGVGLVAGALYFATVALERLKFQWLHIVGGATTVWAVQIAIDWRTDSAGAMVAISLSIAVAGLVVQAGILGWELRRER